MKVNAIQFRPPYKYDTVNENDDDDDVIVCCLL